MIRCKGDVVALDDIQPLADDMPLLSQWIKKSRSFERDFLEAPPRFELGVRELQSHALPLGYSAIKNGADYEARTRYLHLGKVALYQMS